ncbi:hypothetical protein ACHAXT_000299 [Thalassiosira profunda]
MGRCFSTAYRTFLLAASISAVVLSILSATSCSFLTFDHQYKSSGRFLFRLGGERALQDPDEGDATEDPMDFAVDPPALSFDPTGGDPESEVPEDTPASGGAMAPMDETPSTPVDAPAVDTPNDIPGDEATAPDLAAAAEAAAAALDETPAGDEPVPVSTPVLDEPVPVDTPGLDEPAPVDNPVLDEPAPVDPMAPAPALDQPTPVTTPALEDDPTVGTPALDEAAPVSDPTLDEPAPFDPMASAPALDETTTETEATASFWNEEPEDDPPLAGPGSGQGSSEPNQEANTGAFGSSAYDGTSSASGQVPIATASGDAGLFCEGEQTFKITNLWRGSIQDLEDEIDSESQGNQSEELARGAALAATVFGMLAAVVLILEMMMGFRICLERWIVGLISLCACICQGVTFLFFNSERYCDGDIVNEILNQEPCVVGQGGVFSVVALIIYAIMWIMSCRLPKDDPYGVFCNNKDSTKSTQDGSSGQFGLLGSKTDSLGSNGESNTARTGQERERPNWMSEEANDEENEII